MVNRSYCCVDGCLNRKCNKHLSFFSLPKEPKRRNEWLKVFNRPDLVAKQGNVKHKSYHVCSEHFEKSMVSTKVTHTLLPTAIPTRCLPNQPETWLLERESKKSSKSTQNTDPFVNKLSSLIVQDCSQHAVQAQQCKSVNTLPDHELVEIKTETLDPSEDFRSENRWLEFELDKINKETETRNSFSLTSPDEDDEDITRRFHKLVKWFNSVRNKQISNRCNSKFKFFALDLHLSNPSSYRSLKTLLKLPSESTLSRIKLNIGPKLDERIMNIISKKLQALPDAAKHCTLSVDEMVLKRHLYYDIKNDEVIGLKNLNGTVTEEIASTANVIMLRGIFVNWNQPLCYALTGSHQELGDWIDEIISMLFTLGIKVKAIVSGPNFDQYAKEVKRVTAAKPYFMFQKHKIYYIFDAPNLLKCVRNNFLTSDFMYGASIISWNYIRTLYSHQKEQNLHLIPKITDAHIDPDDAQKTKLEYASQIFSHTMYGAMNTFIHFKLLPREAKATAEFIKSMNDLFDVLNSNTVKSSNKYKRAFSADCDQSGVLDSALNMFKTIMATNRRSGAININRMTTLYNFQITIQAIKMLSKDLKKEGFNTLLTRRLNQDPLQNLFTSIRHEAGKCSEPTPIQFRRGFSKLFLCHMLKKSPTSTCQEDLSDIIPKSNKFLLEGTKSLEKISKAPEPSLMLSLDGDVSYRFDLPIGNPLTYVSAYLLFKCLKKHKCRAFMAYSTKSAPQININTFAHFKAVNVETSFYGLLKVPPESFTDYIEQLEKMFINNFEQHTSMIKKPANSLLSVLKTTKFDVPCSCFPKEYLLKLFIRFRMFAAIRLNNSHLREENNQIQLHNSIIIVKQLLR